MRTRITPNTDTFYAVYLLSSYRYRSTLKEKFYNELGVDSLQNRQWYRKLSFLYKVIVNQSPSYLLSVIPRNNTTRSTRGSNNIPLLGTKHNFFQNSYFKSAIKEWNRFDIDIQKSDSSSIFKKRILSFIRPLTNKVSISHNPQGLKLLIRLRLGPSHLRYHKFKLIFWILLIHSVVVALISKQIFIFFSIAQTLWKVETSF